MTGTALLQAHSDSSQPATTYLKCGVPQKRPSDSHLVHGGIFMLLKIKRLEEFGRTASNVELDLKLGMTFNYINMSCPDK